MPRIRPLAALLLAALALPAALAAQRGADRAPGWLGISFSVEEEDGRTEVTVVSVAPGSPASRAFLRAGDVVLRIDGEAASDAVMARMRERLQVGDTVRLLVREPDGDEETRVVVAGARREVVGMEGFEMPPIPRIEHLPPRAGGAVRGFIIDGDTVEVPPLDSLLAQMDSLRAEIRILRPGDGPGRILLGDGDSVRVFRFDSTFVREFRNDTTWKRFREDVERSFGPEFRARFERDFGPGGERLRIWSDSVMTNLGPMVERDVIFHGEVPAFLGDFGLRALGGAEFAELNAGLGRYFRRDRGLLVLAVAAGSPAARAGLEPGDVVTAAGGEEVATLPELRRATARAAEGRLRLSVLRDGRARQVEMEWSEDAPRVLRFETRRGTREN